MSYDCSFLYEYIHRRFIKKFVDLLFLSYLFLSYKRKLSNLHFCFKFKEIVIFFRMVIAFSSFFAKVANVNACVQA